MTPSTSRVPAIIPLTDLRQNAASVLGRMRASRQPVVITQRGRAAAVLMSMEEFERVEHERQVLRQLARGEREIAKGKGMSLDRVLEDADALLADDDE
jgi:prevent-host-death family protein